MGSVRQVRQLPAEVSQLAQPSLQALHFLSELEASLKKAGAQLATQVMSDSWPQRFSGAGQIWMHIGLAASAVLRKYPREQVSRQC